MFLHKNHLGRPLNL